MATISSTDNVFATAYAHGAEVFSFAGSGINDMSDIISKMRNHPTTLSGMVTLTVRNSSRGWSLSRSIYFA